MKLREIWRKLKRKWSALGYTCDGCDKEVFDYPNSRLCVDCQNALVKNDKFACEKCGRATVTEGLCLNCKSILPVFEKGFSPLVYHGEVAGLVNRFKGGKAYLASTFASYMVTAYQASGIQVDGVVFVPLTVEKARTRGYDQAELLAQEVADSLGLPLLYTLICLDKKEQQKELSLTERRDNVAGMYRVIDRQEVKDKVLLLIDDIMTTGATGSECASRLKKAGAKAVYFLTAAALPERK